MSGFTMARLVTVAALLLALGKLPYSYYTLVRFLCCVVAAYVAYVGFESKKPTWAWVFGAVALLFNPFVPLRLDRWTWAALDVATALLIFCSFADRSLNPGQRRDGALNEPQTPVEESAPTESWEEQRLDQWQERAFNAEKAAREEQRKPAKTDGPPPSGDSRLNAWTKRAYSADRPSTKESREES
jgi:Family of unknown function (DUF6804)